MHELDISVRMPEPQGLGEASEESGVNIKNSENSPAIAQGSTSLEPLAGELLGDAPGAEDEVPQQFGPKRLREAGMSSEAVVSSRPLYMPVAHLETQISRIHILDI
jgi:hypothetical protein